MLENKKGIIVCFAITIISGIVPIFISSESVLFTYLLAIFGSALLSFSICVINYRTAKRLTLREIILETYYLEYTAKIQTEITLTNSLNKKQIIEICSFIRNLLLKEFDKIDLCISGLFCWNKKGKNLLLEYRADLYENVYQKYVDLYLFLTTADDSDYLEVTGELGNHLFELATYNEFLVKKDKVKDYFFLSKDKSEQQQDIQPEQFIQDYKEKLKNKNNAKEQRND